MIYGMLKRSSLLLHCLSHSARCAGASGERDRYHYLSNIMHCTAAALTRCLQFFQICQLRHTYIHIHLQANERTQLVQGARAASMAEPGRACNLRNCLLLVVRGSIRRGKGSGGKSVGQPKAFAFELYKKWIAIAEAIAIWFHLFCSLPLPARSFLPSCCNCPRAGNRLKWPAARPELQQVRER